MAKAKEPKTNKIDKKVVTKEQKRKVLNAKMRMHEQTVEAKLNKEIQKELKDKSVVNHRLLILPIVTAGVKNKYETLENKLIEVENQIKELKENGKKPSDDLLKEQAQLKGQMKVEKTKLKSEIKQIDLLNKKPKGVVNKVQDQDVSIEVKGINKLYSTKGMIFQALKDANLEIKRGSFNVILGPSGSGKTTLLNIISGLDKATYGEVIINGTNIQALNERETTQFRRHNIGFVFQSYNLLSSLDVNDNIEVGRSLQTNAHKRQSIDKLLKSMDMLHNKNKKTYELSGGQQQRVSIARALAKTPDILIGDEPTGALDQVTSLKVFELFQKINKENGTTVIIVTHNPNVAKLADKVIHVKNGRIDQVIENKKPIQANTLTEI